jgi:hypothetical protein
MSFPAGNRTTFVQTIPSHYGKEGQEEGKRMNDTKREKTQLREVQIYASSNVKLNNEKPRRQQE